MVEEAAGLLFTEEETEGGQGKAQAWGTGQVQCVFRTCPKGPCHEGFGFPGYSEMSFRAQAAELHLPTAHPSPPPPQGSDAPSQRASLPKPALAWVSQQVP